MTEETNPTQEANEPVPTAESFAVPPADIASVLDVQLAFTDDAGNGDNELVVEELEVEGEIEEAEEEVSSGPGEYVEQERGGRTRRTATDIRLEDVNYRNIAVLSRFLDRRGRILSRRKTRVSAKMQRRVVREIKRARHLALLPYTADQTRIVRRRK